MRRGDRTFLNMQEQGVLFFGSLWLYAVFVSASDAADLGKVYLVLRALYPIIWMVFGGEKGFPQIGMMFTVPQYAINLFEVVAVILKLGYGADLTGMFFGYKALGVFVFNIGFASYSGGVVASLQEKVFAKYFGKEK